VDLAGVIDAGARTRLNALLKDLEARTTAQMVILTINSLEGEPIENFSHQTAVKWGIGQKGKDNGVLLTVAVKDHKYRIEVGYGLEATLPDSLVGSIGRQYLVPHFRKGDFAGGIVAAAGEIAQTISRGAAGGQAGEVTGGEQGGPGGGVTPQSSLETPPPKEGEGSNQLSLVLIILSLVLGPMLLIWLISWRIKKMGKGHGGGYWGGGWSSGGGSSWGGGDSSDFGGGGGDFGGGGASGDW